MLELFSVDIYMVSLDTIGLRGMKSYWNIEIQADDRLLDSTTYKQLNNLMPSGMPQIWMKSSLDIESISETV